MWNGVNYKHYIDSKNTSTLFFFRLEETQENIDRYISEYEKIIQEKEFYYSYYNLDGNLILCTYNPDGLYSTDKNSIASEKGMLIILVLLVIVIGICILEVCLVIK